MKILIVVATIVLAGCSVGTPPGEERPNRHGMSQWTDPDSGCKYLLWREMRNARDAYSGIAPKFKADGTPDCAGETE